HPTDIVELARVGNAAQSARRLATWIDRAAGAWGRLGLAHTLAMERIHVALTLIGRHRRLRLAVSVQIHDDAVTRSGLLAVDLLAGSQGHGPSDKAGDRQGHRCCDHELSRFHYILLVCLGIRALYPMII